MISPQDFERLSAYLDSQLPPKEKAALEARLAHEPELRTALDDLRRTVRALRSLPKVKLPRNFTLSARQVDSVAQRRLFPTMRLATSMAALTLVLVFAGDFIASRAPVLSPAAPLAATVAEQQNAAYPEATAAEVFAKAAAAPTQMMDQSTAEVGASGGTGLLPTPSPESSTPMAAAAVSAAAAPATTDTTLPAAADEQPTESAAEPAAAARLAPTQAPAPLAATAAPPAAAPESAAEARQAATEAPALLTPTETMAPLAAEAYLPPTPELAAAPVAPAAPSASAVTWRAIEAGLVGLTLVLAMLTWLVRRR